MGIMCVDKVFVWENPEAYSAAILAVPRPNYREVIETAIQSFDRGDFSGAMQKVCRLRRDYNDVPAGRKLTIELFSESLEGVILYRQGNVSAGAYKMLKVLSHPQWGLLVNSSYGYPRYILLTAAGICQRAGRKKDAAELYRRVADLYAVFEPMEREFYLALSALCLGDKTTALRHFENAQKFSPDDVNIRKNIEILKKHVR
jgi:tetratricopeptide (TPR) repeat protein